MNQGINIGGDYNQLLTGTVGDASSPGSTNTITFDAGSDNNFVAVTQIDVAIVNNGGAGNTQVANLIY